MEKYVIHPIVHTEVWSMYKKHVASFWTVEEIDIVDDYESWLALDDAERRFIECILAFFAASDGIVLQNVSCNFIKDFAIAEVRAFYSFQCAMETIHSETYSMLLTNLVRDESRRLSLFNAIEHDENVKQKAQWTLRYMCDDLPLATRLVAFACVEGIFFSSSFCAIYWLKKRGCLPGVTFSNELIARDEGLHTEFSCLLYKKYVHEKLDAADLGEILTSAVALECEFVQGAIPDALVGINSERMCQYVRYVGSRLAMSLGHEPIWFDTNPFEWMEMISMQGKTNFFEKRVGEYQKANVASKSRRLFRLDDEF